MTTNEIVPIGVVPLALPSGLADQTRAYADSAHSEATRRAYHSDWRDFAGWCEAHGLAALPATAETVALYLAAQIEAGRKTATVQRRLASMRDGKDSQETGQIGVNRRFSVARHAPSYRPMFLRRFFVAILAQE